MLRTFVMRPCMMRKFGLFTFICTLQNISDTFFISTTLPFIQYLFLPPTMICRVTEISLHFWYPIGQQSSSELSNTMVTDALVMPAWPFLYTSSWSEVARTWCTTTITKTKREWCKTFHNKGFVVMFYGCAKCSVRLTWSNLEIPSTKQIESKMLDLPVPFKPVMAVNSGSKSLISVRLPYDLKPSNITDLIYMILWCAQFRAQFKRCCGTIKWKKINAENSNSYSASFNGLCSVAKCSFEFPISNVMEETFVQFWHIERRIML